jgi:hypothetical protein
MIPRHYVNHRTDPYRPLRHNYLNIKRVKSMNLKAGMKAVNMNKLPMPQASLFGGCA